MLSGARFARSVASAARAAPSVRGKHTVVLVRHGESIWNMENRFTGARVRRKNSKAATRPARYQLARAPTHSSKKHAQLLLTAAEHP